MLNFQGLVGVSHNISSPGFDLYIESLEYSEIFQKDSNDIIKNHSINTYKKHKAPPLHSPLCSPYNFQRNSSLLIKLLIKYTLPVIKFNYIKQECPQEICKVPPTMFGNKNSWLVCFQPRQSSCYLQICYSTKNKYKTGQNIWGNWFQKMNNRQGRSEICEGREIGSEPHDGPSFLPRNTFLSQHKDN